MADSVATLYVEVNAKDVKNATAALARFEKEAKKTEKQNKKLKDSNDILDKSFLSLKSAVLGYASAIGAREFVNAIDTFITIENKLKNVTDTTGELVSIQQQLFNVSQQTRSSFESTATLYQRLAISTESAGVSSNRLLAVTKGLQQAFIVSGATAQESRNAVIQLAQGLASGQLRGEEFRSVSEQGIRVVKALTSSLGLTVGQLREMAYAGELTTDIFLDAFEKQLPKINDEFKEFDATIAQSATTLNNSFINFVGRMDDAVGASSAASKSIIELSDDLDDLAKASQEAATTGLIAVGVAIAFLSGGAVTAAAAAIGYTSFALDDFAKRQDRAFGKVPDYTTGFSGLVEIIREAQSRLSDPAFRNSASDVRALGDALKEAGKKNALKKSISLQKEAAQIQDMFLIKAKDAAAVQERGEKAVNDAIIKRTKKKEEAAKKEADLEKERQLLQKKSEDYSESKEKENTANFREQLADRKAALLTFSADYAAIEEERLANSKEASDGAQRAFNAYIESATDDAANMESLVSSSFSEMEDALVSFVETGKVDFSSLADSIISDMIRIAAQQAITGVLSSAVSAFSTSSSGNTTEVVRVSASDAAASRAAAFAAPSAHGNAFNSSGKINYFASGGVVNSATGFTFGNGQNGVMGEAGPEAILPLKRGSSGDLGVSAEGIGGANVYVNVQNNSSESASVSESTDSMGNREITVMIGEAVKSNFQNGSMDKTMTSLYGLSRQGS